MLTGRSQFAEESTSDVLAAILDRDPLRLVRFDPDILHELQRIVTKGLRKDPRQLLSDHAKPAARP